MKPEIPEDFKARISRQLTDANTLFAALDGDSPVSLRLNPNKSIGFEIWEESESVFWDENGRYLQDRPHYGKEPLYHAGAYYPMEASSMFLGYALRQLSLSEDATILDVCAAPGGKTLLIKDQFPGQLLVSNEIDARRVHVLRENSIRWGTDHHMIVHSDASALSNTEALFDLILVDAPCSGEGLFRKDVASRSEWTSERAYGCSVRQRQILEDTIGMLNGGGYLIYSTCTYNPDENHKQIEYLVHQHGLKTIGLCPPKEWDVDTITENGNTGYQFWPHRLKGEGFFVSVLTKDGDRREVNTRIPKPKPLRESIDFGLDLKNRIVEEHNGRFFAFSEVEWKWQHILNGQRFLRKGLFLGEIKGRDFMLSHDAAMHTLTNGFSNKMDLNKDDAIHFLKGNAVHVQAEKGPVILTHQGLSIGVGKSNGMRINNALPKHLRIH